MTDVITSIYKISPEKPIFFGGCSWFKFNNLELALGIAFKFYTSVVKKVVETKSQKILGSNPYVCRSYSGKPGWGAFFGQSNIFKTFIKVRYNLLGKILSGKIFLWGKFWSLSQ